MLKVYIEYYVSIPGSFFPPREITKSDVVHVYDKDLCRVWALRYRKDVIKDGVTAGYYTPDDNLLETVDKNADNACFCEDDTDCVIKGLQYIGPCQFSEYNTIDLIKCMVINTYYARDFVKKKNC